ncbi:MAG: hypothetical protein LC750_01930 [Actinobacteria bacterium]|nr:hypothetical protein [Actinomycetota bacterium]
MTYGRHPLGEGLVWLHRAFILILAVGAVVSGLRQPIFFLFAAFVLIGGSALLWTERMRGDARELAAVISEVTAS